MDREKKNKEIDKVAIAADLDPKKMQSFRTTFNLTIETIQYISEKSKELEISQKAFFDFMCGVLNSEPQQFFEKPERSEINLDNNKKRKAYVISRKARSTLKEISKTYKISRDDIVDKGFLYLKYLLPVVEITHEDLNKALIAVSETLEVAEKNEDQIQTIDFDNPIRREYGEVIIHLYNVRAEVERQLADFPPVESDEEL